MFTVAMIVWLEVGVKEQFGKGSIHDPHSIVCNHRASLCASSLSYFGIWRAKSDKDSLDSRCSHGRDLDWNRFPSREKSRGELTVICDHVRAMEDPKGETTDQLRK